MSTNIHPPEPSEPSACRKKPRKAATSVVLPLPLQRAVIKRAREEERSFSAVVRIALDLYIKRADGDPAA